MKEGKKTHDAVYVCRTAHLTGKDANLLIGLVAIRATIGFTCELI